MSNGSENYIIEENGEWHACYANGTKGRSFDTYAEAEAFMNKQCTEWEKLE